MDLALTGRSISADRALAFGLISQVVPAEALRTESLELAQLIASNAPIAVRESKRVLSLACDLPEQDGWEVNNAAIPVVFGSEDAKEGPIAFAEKREPVWTGR
jgi:crotonobetainyl-CoA hydratase